MEPKNELDSSFLNEVFKIQFQSAFNSLEEALRERKNISKTLVIVFFIPWLILAFKFLLPNQTTSIESFNAIFLVFGFFGLVYTNFFIHANARCFKCVELFTKMHDAVNYYYNNESKERITNKYISMIMHRNEICQMTNLKNKFALLSVPAINICKGFGLYDMPYSYIKTLITILIAIGVILFIFYSSYLYALRYMYNVADNKPNRTTPDFLSYIRGNRL